MSSAPVPVVSAPEPPVPQTLVCMNCGTPLAGEYCTACGQRHEPHLHTVGHFAGEAFESITHADSRLWRTLGYLLAKPGVLTREFFAGRRARYLPPFRLYLVISLAFFLIAGVPGFVDAEATGESRQDRVAGLNAAADALEKDEKDNPEMAQVAAGLRDAARKEKARIDALKASGADEATIARESRDTVRVGFCEQFEKPDPQAGWNYTAMQGFCKKMAATSGREFLASIIHNIPRAMFVFLPLLALVMKLLYWRPKRYYVEHLLFLVHNHAFVFLAFAIVALTTSIPVAGGYLGFLDGLIWLYMFWYIFRAMRVFYGQSRVLTFTKYVTIGFAYLATSILVLVLTAIFSALML
jgi:uncharacterized protein DUF3667